MFHKTLTYDDLHISPADVYRQMGYGDVLPDAAVRTEVSAVTLAAAAVARPQFCFHVVSGTLDDRRAELHVGATTLGVRTIIARQLRGSVAFALFVCTAGDDYEQWRLRQTDALRSYVADALGSVVAEHTADCMEQALQATVDKLSWHRTNRFSPGYCGWNVGEQPRLFGLLGTPAPCGVRLTASSLMVPVKSVSGVIGLGPDVSRRDYACAFCNARNCFKRKK